MKNTIVLLMMLGWLSIGNAQQLSPAVLATDGASSRGPTLTLHWTLGELAVQTFRHPGGLLTEGFHQPLLEVTDIPYPITTAAERVNIAVYPNPVTAWLKIQLSSDEPGRVTIRLLDYQGRTLVQTTGPLQAQALDWDLSSFPAGLYVLTFREETGTLLKQCKVIKAR